MPTLYRIAVDPACAQRWFLNEPINSRADEWAFWRLLRAEELDGDDLRPWKTTINRNGVRLPFSFAGFDVPVLDHDLSSFFDQTCADDAQLVPLEISGQFSGHHILVAKKAIDCIDESRSRFTKWTAADGRPEKEGQYRMITQLVLDPTRVPSNVSLFRVAHWTQALVATEPLVSQLRQRAPNGLSYSQVG